MAVGRKRDLEHRLEAYFATLRASALKRAANWQIYAAVTGSAMAMATSASTSIIGAEIQDAKLAPGAGIQTAKRNFASSATMPVIKAVRSAIARQDTAKAQTSQSQTTPSISPVGVVPLFGVENIIQPGEWLMIPGNNLASGNAVWNGDFPATLGGTSVTINGKAAYLQSVTPEQITLQAPDDTATGTVPVVVTTASGRAMTTVTLSPFAPAFNLAGTNVGRNAGRNYVSGIILRSDGSGAYAGGTYDILGPTGDSLGYATVAALAGDTVELFGGGFGPTTPAVPAGGPFSGSAPIASETTFRLYINDVLVNPTFVGLSAAGLYQINLTVPNRLGSGDVPIRLIIGGLQTQPGVLFPLPGPSTVPPIVGGTFAGSSPPIFFSSGGGGSCCGSGGSGGGSGGGGSFRKPGGKKPYHPKLKFSPQALTSNGPEPAK